MKTISKILIVLGILVIIVVAIIILILAFTKGIADTANKQLDAIKAGDYTKAYSYTSKDFQASTSLKAFEKFINEQPTLKNNESASFTDRETVNNAGTLKGTLKATDGTSAPVEYKLVKEDGEWKILSIDLTVETSTKEDSSTDKNDKSKISKVLTSDKINTDGVVEKGKTSFAATTAEIHTSVYVSDAVTSGAVTAEIMYKKTGEKSDPVTNANTDEGDIVSNFVFYKPTNNWQAGEYQIKITMTNGEKETVEFTVK